MNQNTHNTRKTETQSIFKTVGKHNKKQSSKSTSLPSQQQQKQQQQPQEKKQLISVDNEHQYLHLLQTNRQLELAVCKLKTELEESTQVIRLSITTNIV